MSSAQQTFELHAQLQADTHVLGDGPLCRLLRMDDANFPWFVLVPRVTGVSEIHELTRDDRAQLWAESDTLSRWLMAEYQPAKLNIAALGNKVPQLHVHHVARFKRDACWPTPIWGQCQPVALDAARLADVRERLTRLKGFKAV